jgi:hypothetical protein
LLEVNIRFEQTQSSTQACLETKVILLQLCQRIFINQCLVQAKLVYENNHRRIYKLVSFEKDEMFFG